MAESTKKLLGDFLSQRYKNFDTPTDPFEPLKESFVNIDLPDIELKINNPLPPREPITIGEFARLNPAASQPSLPVSLSKPPAGPFDIDEPPHTMIAARQPSPEIPLSKPPAGPMNIDEPPHTMPARRMGHSDISDSAPPADPIPLKRLELPGKRTGVLDPDDDLSDRQFSGEPQKILDGQQSDVVRFLKSGLPEISKSETDIVALDFARFLKSGLPELPKKHEPVQEKTHEQLHKLIPNEIDNKKYTDSDDVIRERSDSAMDSRLNPFGTKPYNLAAGSDPHGGISIRQKLFNADEALFTFLKNVGGPGTEGSILTDFGNPNGDRYAPFVQRSFWYARWAILEPYIVC